MKRYTVVVLLILRGQLTCSCSNKVIINGTADCCSNFYQDGNVCIECPAGYHGDNCEDMCSLNTYGSGCGQICSCTPCHHIYGCTLPTLSTVDCSEGYHGSDCTEVCPPPTYGPGCKQTCNCSSCHHIYGCNVTLKTEGKQTQYIPIFIFYTLYKTNFVCWFCSVLAFVRNAFYQCGLYSNSCIFAALHT